MIIHIIIIFSLISLVSLEECPQEFIFHDNSCKKCADSDCLYCKTVMPHSCYECSSSFTLYEKQCGLSECDHIKRCSLCNQNECIKCKSICILSNGECKCTERIVIIIVCIILSILVVVLVIYCLTKPQGIRVSQIQARTIIEGGELGKIKTTNENLDLEDYEDLFMKNKIIIGKNIEKKKCELCRKQPVNLKLSCGCFLCNDDDKRILLQENKVKVCPICKREVTDSIPTNCGICFQNKSELCKFSCGCALVVCKDCFIQWKKTKQVCPACRLLI